MGVTDPIYPVYIDSNVMCGRSGELGEDGKWSNVTYLPCTAENHFIPQIPDRRIVIIYLCFPNNPTGGIMRREHLEAIAEVLRDTSILVLVFVVLGGMGSMLGSILSATVLTILPEATRSFDSYRMVVYSLVLVLMMIFRPGGLLGSYDFSLSRIVEKAMNGELFRKHTEKEAADHE